MRPRAWLLCTLVAGCSWSNSLYQARRLSSAAQRAEREERTFDAGSFWGQAAVKADSALARNPDHAEAAWLRGRALARLGDCGKAMPALERARVLEPSAPWRDDLLLELGRCRSLAGEHAAALSTLEPLMTSSGSGVDTDARLLAGHTLVAAGRWQEGLDRLTGIDRPTARVARAVALAGLGRTAEALVELAPTIEARDTTADWERFLRLIASQDADDADRLLNQLSAFPGVRETLRTRWQLAVAEGILTDNQVLGVQRLEALAARPLTPFTSRARVILAARRIAALARGDSLRPFLAELSRLMEGDPVTGLQVGRWYDRVDALADELDSLPLGSVGGDLALFYQAEHALLELQSPGLAAWLYQRIEDGWPNSPYAAKALLARIRLLPDSAAMLRERVLDRYPSNPYVLWLSGLNGPELTVLEDSLGQYIGDRAALAEMRRAVVRPVDVPE